MKELEAQQREGRIDLYYADESHICTEGYVPYGWQFPDEDVYIASGRTARLNIFGMIDRQIITGYNFGNQIGLLKLTVEFAYRKHHLSTCTRSAHDATVFEN